MAELNTEIDTETEKKPREEKPLLHRPTLYETWKRMPLVEGGKVVKPASYFVVMKLDSPLLPNYDLLILFNPEIIELSPEKFSEMADKKIIIPWKL